MSEPSISVVIPSYGRPACLRLCLEGLAAQTAPRSGFEVLVVDDGSPEPLQEVTARFADRLRLRMARTPHRGVSAARNTAIGLARAPLLILGEDDLRPVPQLVDACLDFHERHPSPGDVLLLYFDIDPSLRRNLLLHYLVEHVGHYFGFPARPGVFGPELFWGGAVTCKRALFDHERFDPALSGAEDTEVAERIDRRIPLRVHFERRRGSTFVRDVSLDEVLEREHRMARNRRRRWERGGGRPVCPWYERPDRFLLPSPAVDRIRRTVPALERELRGVDPRRARGREMTRLALLHRFYAAAIGHAAALGWTGASPVAAIGTHTTGRAVG